MLDLDALHALQAKVSEYKLKDAKSAARSERAEQKQVRANLARKASKALSRIKMLEQRITQLKAQQVSNKNTQVRREAAHKTVDVSVETTHHSVYD